MLEVWKDECNQNNSYCVYAHINKFNGKIYVGQTSMKPEHRWNSGKSYKGSTYFYNAIKKYSWDGFYHIIIASNLTKNEADNLEEALIKEFNTTDHNNGYNLMSGGNNQHHSEESLRKISESLCGELHPLYGKHHSEETKMKIGKTQRERYSKNKNNHPMYGKHHSEETKKKISKSNKGKKHTEEVRKRISESHKGIYHTEESKRKISEAHLGAKHPRAKKVIQYDLENNQIKIWDCMSDIEKCLNLSHTNISACCRGKSKTCGGFIWKYYDEVF